MFFKMSAMGTLTFLNFGYLKHNRANDIRKLIYRCPLLMEALINEKNSFVLDFLKHRWQFNTEKISLGFNSAKMHTSHGCMCITFNLPNSKPIWE